MSFARETPSIATSGALIIGENGSIAARSGCGNGYGFGAATDKNSGAGYADDAGEGKFNYTVTTGYYALCTNNIATYG